MGKCGRHKAERACSYLGRSRRRAVWQVVTTNCKSQRVIETSREQAIRHCWDTTKSIIGCKEPPYADPHVRWCERSVNVKCNRLCKIQTYTQIEKAPTCSAPSSTPSPKEWRKGYAAGLKRSFSTASVSSRHHNLLFFHRLTAYVFCKTFNCVNCIGQLSSLLISEALLMIETCLVIPLYGCE